MTFLAPYYESDRVTLYCGDVLDTLRQLPDASVNCCVTSPPYWGLRDYGCDGQIGLEKTPEAHVEHLVTVFREVRRVLRDDGTSWLNLGDSYATGGGSVGRCPGGGDQGERFLRAGMIATQPNRMPREGLKPKDLVGIPWRVAFALQADGWWLRSDIIWSKPNPMPESVTDRPTKAHEYLFMLAKSERYYFDAQAVKEDGSPTSQYRGSNGRIGNKYAQIKDDSKSHLGFPSDSAGRNIRSVWNIATRPFREAHFAVMPEKLVEPCIKAGCPEGGVVLDPFGGSGTVGAVALRLGRKAILVDLKADYCEIAKRRIQAAEVQLPLLVGAF